MKDVWESAKHYLKTAAAVMHLEPEIVERLSTPMRFTEFTIPVRMDNGERRLFTAYRSQHCDALGPCRDGTRVKPDLTREEIMALSMFMSIKHAVGGVPAGGGKGGIKADPGMLSEGEYERLMRGFIRRLLPRGAWSNVPGADIGTGPEQMAWMLDEFEQISGFHSPSAVNDKPIPLGGSRLGYEATGIGVALCVMQACKERSLVPEKSTVAIQGFGQVGSVTARVLADAGYKIVAVGDVYGSITNPLGLDVARLVSHVKETGSVREFPDAEEMDRQALLELDVDVLIPAAVQDVVNEHNVDHIHAPLIVEAANGPTTPEADDVLARRGVMVIPDVLANVGSAVVCHFERIQGLSDDYWDEEEVLGRLRGRMLGAYAKVAAFARDLGVSRRTAAWVYALDKIAEAVRIRGWA